MSEDLNVTLSELEIQQKQFELEELKFKKQFELEERKFRFERMRGIVVIFAIFIPLIAAVLGFFADIHLQNESSRLELELQERQVDFDTRLKIADVILNSKTYIGVYQRSEMLQKVFEIEDPLTFLSTIFPRNPENLKTLSECLENHSNLYTSFGPDECFEELFANSINEIPN